MTPPRGYRIPGGERVQIALRITVELHQRLIQAANDNDRSVSAEIRARLKRTFTEETVQ